MSNVADRDSDLLAMTSFRRSWKDRFHRKDLATLITEHDWFYDLVCKYPHHLDEDEKILEEFHAAIEKNENKIIADGKSQCPIAFFKPSWEQAQILNNWSPEFEPHLASEGYRSACVFCANRIGKTTAMVIDTLLWLLPNDPNWVMFEEMEDTSPEKRGKYRVFRRPDWDYWKRTGKMIYNSSEPPKSSCEVWQGVPNDDHWDTKIAKEYRRWMPPTSIKTWMVADKWFETKWGSVVKAKSYNADVLTWAGKAVWRLNLDEGINPELYTEALIRIQAGGYFHWAYTPAEAKNIGNRTKLAFDVSKLKEHVKPPGDTKIFINFTMANAPEWILPDQKKKDDIRRYVAMGGEGKVRMDGGFFDSSPVVFNNFKREQHILPWSGSEFLKRYPDACLIRGFDEGTSHPTACYWVAILKTGEYVIYREFSQANLSISQRCEQIISLSRNVRSLTHFHANEEMKRYKEDMIGEKIRRTFADSKIFRRNPENPQDDWTDTYRKNGLILERATNIGPAARCDYANDLFLPDHSRKHICNGTEWSHLYSQNGYRAYVTNDCPIIVERFENYLQEQIKSGPNTGKFTGQPGKEGDDEIDACCYALNAKLRWVDMNTVMSRAPTSTAMKLVDVGFDD